MAIPVRIINNIEKKVKEYQSLTGATKTFLANQMGITPARLYQVMKSDNMMLDVIVRIALILNCKIDDLIEYETIVQDKWQI